MDPDRSSLVAREREVFLKALQCAGPAERVAFLDGACQGDAALRAGVESLLAHYQDDGFLETPPTGVRGAVQALTLEPPVNATTDEAVERPGTLIGPYTLEEKLGEGGCGVVYLARQEQPIRRQVALKVIKLGMDTRSVIARFEAERQALAMMDHPCIAKVLDAGATESGRPYFVMELVRGIRITDYCHQNNLSTRERLDLFIKVCQAVQHAHQKGIIHRDLKPSNVLVALHDGVPVPKVIDFGIAKAVSEDALTTATVTQQGQFLGTLTYASPEQASFGTQDIDTRSDIYSLGVLLYELLTGRPPFDFEETAVQAGLDEMRRIIREVEPPKPSTRLTKKSIPTRSAALRQSEIPNLKSDIDKDLDWIAMKALEKDRTRRYATASDLAADIQRHVNHEPVLAGAPSNLYKLQKLIRRNKGAFAAATAVFLALVTGLGLTAWQAVRANRALDELRATAPAFADQARTLAAKERFDEAVEKLAYATKLRPTAPEYLIQRGDLLQCQFQFAQAAAAYGRALQLRPGDSRAQAGVTLCEELLAAPLTPEGRPIRESLSKLHLAMQKQQRPVAELLPVARLLGEERKLLVDYWAARLKELPISSENPIEKRLVVQDDGLLKLDLCDTKVVDLAPLEGMPLGSLNLCNCEELTDLRPLRELRSLTKLDLTSTKVTDLSPLRELKLQELDTSGTKIFDLAPLRGMALRKLSLAGSAVTDLAALQGMPLVDLDLSYTPVTDFSPLDGLPLKICNLRRSRISDLSVLREMPLKELVLRGCTQARNYSALAEIKSLESLHLPDEIRTLPTEEREAIARLREHPRLQRIGTDTAFGGGQMAIGSADAFWKEWDRDAKFFEALNRGGHIQAMTKLPDGSYQLVCNKNLLDLSILADAPVTVLAINKNQVSDLSPIRNLKLSLLNMAETPIKDISPLRGMPLEHLYMAATKVTDLSPLKGMPLRTLFIDGCPITNMSILAEIPTIESLCIPMSADGIESLRSLPKLQRIGFSAIGLAPGLIPIPCCSADVFWKTWDGLKWARTLEATGIKWSATQRTDGFLNVSINSSQFTNCSIFVGASIRELDLSRTSIVDVRPLLDCTNLTKLVLPASLPDADALRQFASNVQLSFRKSDGSGQSADEFWKSWNSLSWARALTQAGVKHRVGQGSDGSWQLTIEKIPNGDLTILSNLPITVLSLGGTTVSNLIPLRGMKLKRIYLFGTRVTDLRPLQGMPLEVLNLVGTQVSDLSPLEGLPLTSLRLHACPRITDISPLKSVQTLKDLTLPHNAKDFAFLRSFPKLAHLSFTDNPQDSYRPSQTAEEFWAEYDQTNRNP